jgi:hypothetical protein
VSLKRLPQGWLNYFTEGKIMNMVAGENDHTAFEMNKFSDPPTSVGFTVSLDTERR